MKDSSAVTPPQCQPLMFSISGCNVSLARIQPVHEEKLKNISGDVDKLRPEMATSQHSTGTQQSSVAELVPNDKLDRFCRKQKMH